MRCKQSFLCSGQGLTLQAFCSVHGSLGHAASGSIGTVACWNDTAPPDPYVVSASHMPLASRASWHLRD